MKKGIVVGTIIGLILIVIWLIKPWIAVFINKPLTEEEVKTVIQEQYEGEIGRIQLIDDEYMVEIRSEKGVYDLRLNSRTGEVTSLEQTENFKTKEEFLTEKQVRDIILTHTDGKIESMKLVEEKESFVYKAVIAKETETINMIIDAENGKILSLSSENSEDISKNITEKQAGVIAIKHVNGGKIDDIELKKNKQTSYYLVEIEFGDEKEASVQVNAISGEIMSVIWDD